MADVDFSVLFEALPVACSILSREWEYAAVNCAYERAAGRSRGQLIGRNVFQVFPGGPEGDSARRLRASLERVVGEGEADRMGLQRYDVEEPPGSGVFQERYWTIVNTPLPGPDGRVAWVVNQVEDVTGFVHRLREAEGGAESVRQALAAGTQELEAELFTRARELQEVNQRLRRAQARERRAAEAARQALQVQQQAIADTSHDLRGPVTGLRTRLEVALSDPEADSRQVLDAALHDAERIGDIVADLLELARLEARTPLDTKPVDLAHLVRTEVDRRGDGHRAPDVRVTVDTEPGVIVEVSPVRLKRLLNNLLDNAERHTRTRVEVTVTQEQGHAIVNVTDDGPGIPADERESVFRRFFRRGDARRFDPEGTGLGLPIARQIAQAHDGSLHIADHTPGTRFTLRLPLRRFPDGA
ncbi:PAS domain-containing sensor histidine kinase [Actinomadura coerulea]|uniref:PAS domain-containing sensor histidine kinase n=1 Tax=Actinomadura coerulea TaxID=46159 RepID=UPI003445B5EC